MTSIIENPHDKAPPPPLQTRALRPSAVRLRGTPVKIMVAGAALVLAGAFVYSFVLQPAGRVHNESKAKSPERPAEVRPAERITTQPASYAQTSTAQAGASALPPPRTGTDSPPVSGGTAGPIGATTASPSVTCTARPAPISDVVRVDPGREARRSGLFFATQDAARTPGSTPLPRTGTPPSAIDAPVVVAQSAAAQADYDAAYGRHVLIAPLSPYEIKAGTMIPAALLTAVDTGRPGPVVAVTTEPVFDTVTGRTLLVPQGAKLIGAQAGDNTYGEKRAFLVWKRLILPNGKSLLLEDQTGADVDGSTGVSGRADRRLLQLGGAILLSGAITTLGEVARSHDNGTNTSRSIIGDVGDASAVQAVQVGGRLIDRELNVQPKVLVRAGAPVEVLLTKDLVLEPAR